MPVAETQDTPGRAAGHRKLLIESVALYGSIHVSLFCHFLSGFLVAKLLGPSLYGLRTVFGLFEQYESATSLGTFNAVEREVPFHRARGDSATAEHITQSVWSANLLFAGIAAVLLCAASLAMRGASFDAIYADFALFLAALIVLNRLERHYLAVLIIDKQTRAMSVLRLIQGGVTALATVTLVFLAGMRGLFLGITIGKVATIAYAASCAPALPRFEVSWSTVRKMVAIGFPIMSIRFLFLFFQTVDKLCIALFLPPEMLGHFAVAAIVSGVLFVTLADAVKVLLAARMMEALDASGGAGSLNDYYAAPTLLIAWLAPLAVGSLVLVVHLPFEHFLPDYLPAIPVARILIMGQYFFAVVTIAMLACISLGRQNTLAMLTVGGILFNAAANVTVLGAGFGIRAVAICTGMSYMAYALVLMAFTSRLLRESGSSVSLRTVSTLLLPWSACLLLAAGVDRLVPVGGLDIARDLGHSSLRVALFVLAYGALLFLLRSRPAFRDAMARLRGGAATVAG